MADAWLSVQEKCPTLKNFAMAAYALNDKHGGDDVSL
jgi:hypothetical protein